MASRQEEKERRRQERLERERQEAAAASRRKRIQYAFGALLAVALVAGAVLLAVSALGGGDDSEMAADGEPGTPAANLPELPPQQESDFQKAAEAAGCELINPAYEGAGHAEKKFTVDDYKTNPPQSGEHTPNWAEDGVYRRGNTPELGMLVHTLEHGRINVQYSPDAPDSVVKNLEALLAEQNDGYHMLLYENTTDMPYEVAATAWTHILGCEEYNDKVPDALRTFRARYIDKGPERVP